MSQITTLNALNAATPWYDLLLVEGDIGAHLVITGTLTVSLQVSNDANQSATKSDEYSVETYTSSVAKQYERPLPRFVRWKVTSYTSGSAVVSVWPAKDTKQGNVILSSESTLT